MNIPTLITTIRHPLTAIIGASLVLNGGLWVLAAQLFPRQNPAAILHYNADVGIDFVGAGTNISVLPLTGTILLVGNTIIGWAIHRADPRAAWTLWSLLPIFQIILLLAFYFIWRINV